MTTGKRTSITRNSKSMVQPSAVTINPSWKYKKVSELDPSLFDGQELEIGEFSHENFLYVRGTFSSATKLMHGTITFFKTIEVALQKSTQLLTVVDSEGSFSSGQRLGTFTKYSYSPLTSHPSPPTQSEFPSFIQDHLQITSSKITNKTLRSKSFISLNFTGPTTISGPFKQTAYKNPTKIFEVIQGWTLNLNGKIFWEQTFASFLERNFGFQFAEPGGIWRIRQIPLKFVGFAKFSGPPSKLN